MLFVLRFLIFLGFVLLFLGFAVMLIGLMGNNSRKNRNKNNAGKK